MSDMYPTSYETARGWERVRELETLLAETRRELIEARRERDFAVATCAALFERKGTV